jgi:threonine/homoserine/homoserine lactone efflux protein
MTPHSYLLFVVASIVLVLIPGPDMIYMLSRCIAQGRRAGVMAALGFSLGSLVHLTAAIAGLSAILATSSVAFTAVKWIGAGYLIYLGITALRAHSSPLALSNDAVRRNDRTILRQAFLNNVLNPKVAMFFLALLPQFVNTAAAHPTLQILLLGLTVNIVALPVNLLIAYGSSGLSSALRRNTAIAGRLQKALGMMFIALGLRLAAQKA